MQIGIHTKRKHTIVNKTRISLVVNGVTVFIRRLICKNNKQYGPTASKKIASLALL